MCCKRPSLCGSHQGAHAEAVLPGRPCSSLHLAYRGGAGNGVAPASGRYSARGGYRHVRDEGGRPAQVCAFRPRHTRCATQQLELEGDSRPAVAHDELWVVYQPKVDPFEEQKRLFQVFSQVDSSVTRKRGGSGLGLAIAHQLCQTMGGHITVKSALGQGSTFTVCVPYLTAESLEASELPAISREQQEFRRSCTQNSGARNVSDRGWTRVWRPCVTLHFWGQKWQREERFREVHAQS